MLVLFILSLLGPPGGAEEPAGASGDIRMLLLKDWEPRSMLRTRETRVEKPAFPVIDVHNHLREAEAVSYTHLTLPTILRV